MECNSTVSRKKAVIFFLVVRCVEQRREKKKSGVFGWLVVEVAWSFVVE